MSYPELDPHHDRFFSALSSNLEKKKLPLKIFLIKEDQFLVVFGTEPLSFSAQVITAGDESFSYPGLGFFARDMTNPHIVGCIAEALGIPVVALQEYLEAGTLPAGILGGPYALAILKEASR